MPFSESDLSQIRALEIEPATVEGQIEKFRKGVRFTRLEKTCTVGEGILGLSSEEQRRYLRLYQDAQAQGRVGKFVPASGAATRMFKALQACYNWPDAPDRARLKELTDRGDSEAREVIAFLENLEKFPFYESLRRSAESKGVSMVELGSGIAIRQLLECLLTDEGLHYGSLPKALLSFHRYPQEVRTPTQEHLLEAVDHCRDAEGTCRVHFTLSPEHETPFMEHWESACRKYETEGTVFRLSHSFQKPSTQTIAVDLDNNPFREEDGSLLFRPAGHGALLVNLEETGGDLVFIKNIDNVLPDGRKEESLHWKHVLGGVLVEVQEKVFTYLRELRAGKDEPVFLDEVMHFIETTFWRSFTSEQKSLAGRAKAKLLGEALDRPLRACAMVKNTGEPGGGPFFVRLPDGSLGLQIVEPAQVDMADAQQASMLQESTHFNPTDLVCALKNNEGRPFDLDRYRDADSGFITQKSKGGRDLKALEMPGLWNGSMAYWNSIFIETPHTTFAPVKMLSDLLRPEHQPVES